MQSSRFSRSGYALRRILTGGLLLWVGLMSQTNAQGEVYVTQLDYSGWPGAYRLTNGTVELVFVPQLGRIMRYGYVGGPNVLWNNPDTLGLLPDLKSPTRDWVNFGGDKLWPAPQSRWGWPPEPVLDRGGQTVTITEDNHLRVTGLVSATAPTTGLRFVREIVLSSKGTTVKLTNELQNRGSTPVEWSVWEVAQINDPTEMQMTMHKQGRFPTGYYNFDKSAPAADLLRLTGSTLTLRRNPKQSAKIGGDAPDGTLSAHVQGVTFTIGAKVVADKTYPDDGCSQEIYTNPDPLKYVELEILGPLTTLKPKGRLTLVTQWTLNK